MFNYACARTTLFGLWTDTISAVEYLFFFQKNSVQYLCMDPKRSSYQCTVQYRGWQSCFLNIVGCCNFTEVKSREVCTLASSPGPDWRGLGRRLCVHFCWTRGYFSKSEWCLQQNTLSGHSTLKTVHLEHCLLLLVAWMVRVWFKSLQFHHVCTTARTIQFLLWVSLFSCSVFGSCSLVLCNHFVVSKLQPMTAPHYVSRNLKREGSGELCVQAVSHWNAISWMM